MKAFDISKFQKSATKHIHALTVGFSDPKYWVSTGNYALNKLISNDFKFGIPLGKVTLFAGESGAGKSFIVSGNIVRDAIKQKMTVVLIDTENALDKKWMDDIGVDTSYKNLIKMGTSSIDDLAWMVNTFMKEYTEKYADDIINSPPVLFVVDSLSMLLTPVDKNQFEQGDLKGDMGRKPKALTAFMRNCINSFGNYNVGMVVTNHTYVSQDMFDIDDKISGGRGITYASSIIVLMNRMNLKEEADGSKSSNINGIRAKCKVVKTRFIPSCKNVIVKIFHKGGMDAYSGLVELMESAHILTKNGNKLEYKGQDGTHLTQFRKAWANNTDGCLDMLMKNFDNDIKHVKLANQTDD